MTNKSEYFGSHKKKLHILIISTAAYRINIICMCVYIYTSHFPDFLPRNSHDFQVGINLSFHAFTFEEDIKSLKT